MTLLAKLSLFDRDDRISHLCGICVGLPGKKGPQTETGTQTQAHKESVTDEGEVGVVLPQAREHQRWPANQPPDAKGGMGQTLLPSPQKELIWLTPCSWTSGL